MAYPSGRVLLGSTLGPGLRFTLLDIARLVVGDVAEGRFDAGLPGCGWRLSLRACVEGGETGLCVGDVERRGCVGELVADRGCLSLREGERVLP